MNGLAGLNVHWIVEAELKFEEELVLILDLNLAGKTVRATPLN